VLTKLNEVKEKEFSLEETCTKIFQVGLVLIWINMDVVKSRKNYLAVEDCGMILN
tara:strand:+ start:2985 stop:3149 length:165 start_codon:yes stop_codon:yes gene_type:complete